MYANEIKATNDATAMMNEKASEQEQLRSRVESAAKRGNGDNIISAETTRKQLVYAYEMLFTKRESRPSKKHGTV